MKVVSVNLKQDIIPAVSAALEVLKRGGVVVYPTDTVYGLGANACDFRAVGQIFKIKNRSPAKAMPIAARNIAWVRELAFVPPKLEKVLEKIWPGPTTVILPKRDIVPSVISAGGNTVGIRIPDFAFIDKLLAGFGYPLTATSANISGIEGTGDIKRIIDSFKDRFWKPDLIIDAGTLPKNLPSTVLDLSTIMPKILRVGPTKPETLMKLLNNEAIKN